MNGKQLKNSILQDVYKRQIVLTMCSVNINAQTVGYTYRPLAAEGCNMKYSVAKQDTAYYICLLYTSRIREVAQEITNYLKSTDRMAKTIVFCADETHAERMRIALANANADMCKKNPDVYKRQEDIMA